MANCTLEIQKDKLPKIIEKVEFFMFRAVEKTGVNLFDLTGNKKTETVKQLLNVVKNEIIPEYYNEYIRQAAGFKEADEPDQVEAYEGFATNLQNMLLMWDKIVPNFIFYSEVFRVRNKFTLDSEGLVDLKEMADDDEKVLAMLEFDHKANEVDPLDTVNEVVELYIRSLIMEDEYDEYGFTVGVNYADFIKQLFTDLEGAMSLKEMSRRLESMASDNPVYSRIVDKISRKPTDTTADTAFRLSFRNTFAKAYIPINLVSVENLGNNRNVIKVFEASTNAKSFYETTISNRFFMFGMPVEQNGQMVNLASRRNGVWVLDRTSAKKIEEYLENAPIGERKKRRLEILKGIGFTFNEKSEEVLLNSNYLADKNSKISYVIEHLINILRHKNYVTNPYRDLISISVEANPQKDITKKSYDQRTNLSDFIQVELNNNRLYNVEKTVVNAKGDNQYAIQLHMNFTVVNKMLSDHESYPTLQDIIQEEPSMFWLDPEQNVSIRSSLIMNSLFYMDPADLTTYGKRRRVVAGASGGKVFSHEKGEFVRVIITNTGGLQAKAQGEREIDIMPSADSTTGEIVKGKEKFTDTDKSNTADLSDTEKLLQDMNSFFVKGYNSILRLSDKSTDLGIMLNYYNDPSDFDKGMPMKRPLQKRTDSAASVFESPEFKDYVKKALVDIMALKYLNKKGAFLDDLKLGGKNIKNTFSYLDKVFSASTKETLNKIIEDATSVDQISVDAYDGMLDKEIVSYFEKYAKDVEAKLNPLKNRAGAHNLLAPSAGGDFLSNIKFYLANSFIMDMEQMKMFFGNSIYFKDFHKRSSKDSATGIITFMEEDLIEELNSPDGYGRNNNLAAKMLIERLAATGAITAEQRMSAMAGTAVSNTYNSMVLKDVKVTNSKQPKKIADNVKILESNDLISKGQVESYYKHLQNVIQNGYNGTNEADGQGKCTFDFYRIMSIDTQQWSDKQEEVYRKIVMYDHYDRLADATENENQRAEYIRLRNEVGYDPLENVYFPPKKFQYSGPMLYQKIVDGQMYSENVPVFDKFSLAPLIPTITKNTPDDELSKSMLYNNVGYAKYESGTKAEMPLEMDSVYENYDSDRPGDRPVKMFSPAVRPVSVRQLFWKHLKEQVKIDAQIHDESIFGSQIRKLIMMNIENDELWNNYNLYKELIDKVSELEKNQLFHDLGVERLPGNKLRIKDMNLLVSYFFNEIDKKNQDVNVRKALKYNEATKGFEIPLDAAVQAQMIENIIMSAINNRVVRYRTNGSMLTQVAITGTERMHFSKSDSIRAAATFGDDDLAFYDLYVDPDTGEVKVTPMQVKVALTGRWLKLLNLIHPDGFKIESLERLNNAISNDEWRTKHKDSLQMVAYRIPTQGMNFLDVMEVKEFLPASFGDAIILPSAIVVKSGTDFDIDKMFVFYPNLDNNGQHVAYEFEDGLLKENIEDVKDRLFENKKYLKQLRKQTLEDYKKQYRQLRNEVSSGKAMDTALRGRIDRLIRQVQLGIALMDAEDRNIQNHFQYISRRNLRESSVMQQVIRDSAMFNLDEYRKYMMENKVDLLNPSNWIDIKRQGLEHLLESLNNLRNESLDQKTTELQELKTEIEEFRKGMDTALEEINKELYKYRYLKGNLQNRLYKVMANTILHPSNYIQLVTPSENFMIMPIVDDIYKRLDIGVDSEGKHIKTDYTHTDILNRLKNAEKFISLLRGKGDLGIAAVANTFNVLLQISNGKSSSEFLKKNKISSFFETTYQDGTSTIKKNAAGMVEEIDYSQVYDEDGYLKSEFYSEFISAFVDAAKDDYVFAVNVVSELSPIMFYMKYKGLSTAKILYFINQPVMRKYIKYMMEYDNKFVWASGMDMTSVRTSAMNRVLSELGVSGGLNEIGSYLKENEFTPKAFTAANLAADIKSDKVSLGNLSKQEQLQQLAYLMELNQIKKQSNSFTELQSALNFDTKPYSSSYDVFARTNLYKDALDGKHILSAETVSEIRANSMISPLNVAKELVYMLEELFPVRNSIGFNKELLDKIKAQRRSSENKAIETPDDEKRFARVARNDFMNFILQNYFESSEQGNAFFREYFNTNKTLNQYLHELATTDKLRIRLQNIQDLEFYDELVQRFPIIHKVVPEIGSENKQLYTFRIIKSSNHVVEQNNIIFQFQEIVDYRDPDDPNNKDIEMVRMFFRDLSLYSLFQSGMNTSDNSYTNLTPVEITNWLYGFALEEYKKLSDEQKKLEYKSFFGLFAQNNRELYGTSIKGNAVKDSSKRGKWYAKGMKLTFPVAPADPKDTDAKVEIVPATMQTKKAAREGRGIYSMKPKVGDAIPGVSAEKNLHFGNPWHHKAGNQYFEEFLPVEGLTEDERIEAATKNYEDWIRGVSHEEVEPERRKWIAGLIEEGRLDGKTFLYNRAGYKSHADVLTMLINESLERRTKQAKPKQVATREYTPEIVTRKNLPTNAVFVFGSNTEGRHGRGAALTAVNEFGAVLGQARGLQGRSYAIVTKDLSKGERSISLESIGRDLDVLFRYAYSNRQMKFYVTKIGSSLAGYTLDEMREVFRQANERYMKENNDQMPSNIILPKEYEVRDGERLDTKENPLVKAGVKPDDMYGNAAKDIQMAAESTQFIGFGTIMKKGNISSTDKYAAAWGNQSNTGNYSADDVIMISGSGNFGRGGVDKTEEAAAIRKTLTEKYKPLLEKAVAAGASFRVGNQYSKGNLSDELVAKYLQQKGYKEEKLNGYSRWTAPLKASEMSEELHPVYSKLGSKTQSENVIIKAWKDLMTVTTAIFSNGVVSTRLKNSTEHFGNPFSHEFGGQGSSLIKTDTIQQAVENYIDWLTTDKFPNLEPKRKAWILSKLTSGELKGRSVVYYKELGEPSHATALDYLINKYNWGGEGKKAVSPQQKAEVKKIDTPLSTKEKPLQIYSDGSHIKGTSQIGFGAVFAHNGKTYDLSGTENSVEVGRLKALFQDAEFSNPTMEMLALVAVLNKFKNTAEHIEINQDYTGAVNYEGLWERSEGSEKRMNKPWKASKPYIKTLVQSAQKLIQQIEANGGSVKIRWVKGHSGNKMNDLADRAAKSREIFNNFDKAYLAAPEAAQHTDPTLLAEANRIIALLTNANVLTMPVSAETVVAEYNTQKQPSETLEEFIKRKFCKG